MGVKTVDDNDMVVFTPIRIVRAEIDGLYVSGLSDAVRIITVGQGFVNEGEKVAPSLQTKADDGEENSTPQDGQPALPIPDSDAASDEGQRE